MRYLFLIFTIFGLSSWCLTGFSQSEIQIPVLRAPVMDEAGFLSEAEEQDLNKFAYEINTHKGPQITIFTVPDLQGYEIEDFSIRVAERWQLGTKEAGNGLLFIVAKAERKMRIEVGQGLEGDITDYESNQYIRNILAPAFKQGRFHAGFRAVMEDVAAKFNIKPSTQSRYVRRSAAPIHISPALVKIFPILVLIVIIGQILLSRKPVLRGLFTGTTLAGVGFFFGTAALGFIILLFFVGLIVGIIGLHNVLFALASSSGRGRGGFGGGFGGGGGWSGGGGGFSGGGSSGNW